VRRYRASGGELDVDVTYRSFLLAPDTPEDFEGTSAEFLADRKGMPLAQVQQMQAQITQLAAAEGLEYHLDTAVHTVTIPAHQVLHLAAAHGKQLEMVERMFRAHFTEGVHVAKPDQLADLAADVGLDREEVLAALADGRYLDAVEQDFAKARAYGISGVPFFVVDDRYGISGAQDPDVIAGALARATADRADAPAARA